MPLTACFTVLFSATLGSAALPSVAILDFGVVGGDAQLASVYAERFATRLDQRGVKATTQQSVSSLLSLELVSVVRALEYGLPGKDGYQVAQELRSRGLEAARLIAVSGYGRAEDRVRSRAAGFDHHLVKPVAFEKLRELIQAPSAKA